MAIEISNVETMPPLVYDNFFLDKLELSQKQDNDHTSSAKFRLRVTYRLFAVDENNVRYFRNKSDTLDIDDYLALALSRASAGDMDLIIAMQAIENALAKIIEDQTDLGTTTVV